MDYPKELTLAAFYLETGKPDLILENLSNVSSETLDTPQYWFLRAGAYYDLKNFEQSRQEIWKGLQQQPDAIYLLHLLCNCEARLGNIAKAETAILKALSQMPEDPQLLSRYAMLVTTANQLDKAERLLQKAARLAPDHPAVLRGKIKLSYLRGKDNKAIQTGKQALQLNPDDASPHYMMGHAYAAKGHVHEAHKHLGTAASLKPEASTLANSARSSRTRAHWLLLPLRPIQRFGSGPVWIVSLGIIFGLRLLDLDDIAMGFALVYLIFVLYSWTVPFLLKKWMARQYKGFRK